MVAHRRFHLYDTAWNFLCARYVDLSDCVLIRKCGDKDKI